MKKEEIFSGKRHLIYYTGQTYSFEYNCKKLV